MGFRVSGLGSRVQGVGFRVTEQDPELNTLGLRNRPYVMRGSYSRDFLIKGLGALCITCGHVRLELGDFLAQNKSQVVS